MKISSLPAPWPAKKKDSKPSFMDRLARYKVLQFFNRLQVGYVALYEAFDGESSDALTPVQQCGDVNSDIQVSIYVHHIGAYRLMMSQGSIGGAEAFIHGYWRCSDLTNLVCIFTLNVDNMNAMDSSSSRLSLFIQRLGHSFKSNSLTGSKKNIHAHYDLSNALFELFLDERMMYSAAIFDHPQQSLDEAALNKLAQVGKKLQLEPHHHVIEIGTGWGGMAIYLAQTYDCKVTTTTISDEQYNYAKAKVEQLGLGHKITLLKQDYRQLQGQFDRLVSIEMIEAVGHQYFEAFFSKCNQLLKSNGLMVLQAITIPEQRYEYAKRNIDFIQRFIFPGGCLPSLEAIMHHTGQYTDLQIRQLDNIGLHYAKTLKLWRERFESSIDKVHQLGFDESFIRLWQYYLCYCEGGFMERAIDTVQITLEKVKN